MAADTERAARGLALIAIGVIYLAGFLQGITLVSFPASGTVLRQVHLLSDAHYGAIFLPQVALALFGALAGAGLARRVGLRRLLWTALIGNAMSQFLLAGSAWVMPELRFAAVLAATGALGFGFGLSGAPLNSLPPRFFPRHHHSAVVALHTLLGLGLAVGPLLIGALVESGIWVAFPLTLGVMCLLVAVAAARLRLPDAAPVAGDTRMSAGVLGSRGFWGFAAAAVLYAFAEGTFSNWIVIYLSESKSLDAATATLALSVFWAALVLGRLAVSFLVLRLRAEIIWLSLPVLMIIAFLLLPHADTTMRGIAFFALSGLACSAFFPLTITLASRRYPDQVAAVSSMMIAALMAGVGVGSFLIGPLRGLLSLEDLYRLSALYPVAVLLVAVPLVVNARAPVARPAA